MASAAFAVMPMNLSVRSTLGAILIALGQWQSGVDLLRDRRFRMLRRSDRATIEAALAVGLAKLGDLSAAKRALAQAKRLDPQRCSEGILAGADALAIVDLRV